MIEAIAGELNWGYVEITPSQFLDRGVDFVSARADAIFRQVMELDHCVVLLDEIDELIRSRSSQDAETLERFFTTTMLPRLAKLWENRRVLFFVNTNNIDAVDRAIKRSQRFDAALLILPPSYSVKKQMIEDAGWTLDVTADDITTALMKPDAAASAKLGVGWLALIRFDQMAALKQALKAADVSGTVNAETLIVSMSRLSRELSRLDWNLDGSPPAPIPPGATADLPDVAGQYEAERRDSRLQMVARLNDECPDELIPKGVTVERFDDRRWVRMGSPENPEQWAVDNHGVLTPDGIVSFTTSDASGDQAS